MRKIKIDFSDFWGGFDKKNNYFYDLLKEDYDVQISNEPDILFFSLFGSNSASYRSCKKVFYTGENIPPPLKGTTNDFLMKGIECDWSFSFDYLDDDRNYRLPHYLLYPGYYELVNKDIDESLSNRKFCNFVVSNGGCQYRNEFFEKLSKYKKVDSGGRYANNIGGPISDKRKFQSGYKFSIAFENNAYRPQHPGYTTEKIMEPMTVSSMPIYWGNPLISKEFNTESFINAYDYANIDDLIDSIIELDNDDDRYIEKLKLPWFKDGIMPEDNKIENIKSFLHKIIES
jgi:hypothetical protein